VQFPVEKRNLYVAELLSDFNLVKSSLDILKAKGRLVQKDVEGVIATTSNLSGTTIPRRASSLMAWLRWMSEATGSFDESDDGGFEIRK
jgi:hypothetical protein